MSRDDFDILRKLPPSVYRELVQRLARGQKETCIAGWTMTVHRGELHCEGRYAMRKHIAAFASRIKEQGVPPVANCCGSGDCGVQAGKVAGSAEDKDFGRINLPQLTPAELELQTKARAMSPTSRMAVNELANSARRILKLEKEVLEAEAATAPPASSKPEGEKQ